MDAVTWMHRFAALVPRSWPVVVEEARTDGVPTRLRVTVTDLPPQADSSRFRWFWETDLPLSDDPTTPDAVIRMIADVLGRPAPAGLADA